MTDIPAFPHTIEHLHEPKTTGMTLRDYFAAKALQGILAMDGSSEFRASDLAAAAYRSADAMLEARNAAQ
jgi:hypothetical protein